jgi:negative regulator of sigma E activity
MNVEAGIKLQAFLDGELTGREAQQVEALLKSDAEAGALFAELQQTRATLKGNEPEFRLPESGEFFWSKIEREIERLEAAPAGDQSPGWILFLRRHLAAVSGVAVAAALVIFAVFQLNLVSPGILEEIDNPLDDVGTFSFRSESQKMTLVWISNPFPDAEESPEPAPAPEEIQ